VDRENPRVRQRWRLRAAVTAGSQRGTPGWLGRMTPPPQSWWHDDSCGPESESPSVLDHGESHQDGQAAWSSVEWSRRFVWG
jgi:hypothetical protein